MSDWEAALVHGRYPQWNMSTIGGWSCPLHISKPCWWDEDWPAPLRGRTASDPSDLIVGSGVCLRDSENEINCFQFSNDHIRAMRIHHGPDWPSPPISVLSVHISCAEGEYRNTLACRFGSSDTIVQPMLLEERKTSQTNNVKPPKKGRAVLRSYNHVPRRVSNLNDAAFAQPYMQALRQRCL
jgi:hypothetical protein